MEVEACPFCGRKIGDILRHYVLDHGIESSDDFIKRFEIVKMEEEKRKVFRSYVEELKEKRRKNEISAEEFRELTTKWLRDHN